MNRVEEFLTMTFTGKEHTFKIKWLRELQEDMRSRFSQDAGEDVEYYRRKLKDCRQDKDIILQGIIQMLEEKIYEAPIKIQVLSSEDEDEEVEDDEDDVGK